MPHIDDPPAARRRAGGCRRAGDDTVISAEAAPRRPAPSPPPHCPTAWARHHLTRLPPIALRTAAVWRYPSPSSLATLDWLRQRHAARWRW
jgi:hypothetical protein